MDKKLIIDDAKYSVRTQISLSPSMYREIKKRARQERKSMAQVLREAYLTYEHETTTRLGERTKKLTAWVEKTKGMSKGKRGGWGDPWLAHKLIRKEREEEDKMLTKRLGW